MGGIMNMRAMDDVLGNCFGSMYAFHRNKIIRKYGLINNDCNYMPYILYFDDEGKIKERFGKPIIVSVKEQDDNESLEISYCVLRFALVFRRVTSVY